MYADILKKIVNNYKYYKNIAVNLEWVEFDSKYYEWFNNYHIGMFVTVCDFPEDYVKNNFEQAYVQTVLTYIAYAEEFKKYKKYSSAEIIEYIAKNEVFYTDYIYHKDLRMKTVTEDYLINEIWWHAFYNSVREDKVNSLIPYITGAENIKIYDELYGCYVGEHTFISIKNNSIMIIDYVTWGY